MSSPDTKPAMQIDLYSHGMRIVGFDRQGERALLAFCRGLAQFGMVRVGRGDFKYQMVRVYAGRTEDHQEMRFHRNCEQELRRHLPGFGFTPEKVQWLEHPTYEPVKCEFIWKTEKLPRDYQVPYVEYCVAPGKTKVLMMQTGKGKGLTCLRAVHLIGERTMVVVGGKYVQKWMDEINEMFDLAPGELMVVRGSAHLAKLIELAQAGELEAKIIVCTNKTIYNYLESFEKYKYNDVGYHVAPENFYETLGVGVRIIDEVHELFHLNFRQDVYANIPKTISMSATLDSDDAFTNNMFEIVFPHGIRPPPLAHDKYIEMKGLIYATRFPNKLRWKNAMKQYSHTKFEESLKRNPEMLKNYLDMVAKIVMHSYVRVREHGQRCLVYFATVEFCTMFTQLMKRVAPDVKVVRYTSDDEYTDLLQADIGVSTLQSAGTALDIPGLRMVLMTTALSSKQANEQAVGRLRRLKDWPDVTPEFYFLNCRDIPKHLEYAQNKEKKLDGKVLSFKMMHTQFVI